MNKSTYKQGTNINKEFKKKQNVCGMNPNKCPFLSRFYGTHLQTYNKKYT